MTILLYNLVRPTSIYEGLDNKEPIVVVAKSLQLINEAIKTAEKLRRNIDSQNRGDLVSYLNLFKDGLIKWRKNALKSKGDNTKSLHKWWDENRSLLVSSEAVLDPTDKKHGEILDRIQLVRQEIMQITDYVEPPDTDLEAPTANVTDIVSSLFQL